MEVEVSSYDGRESHRRLKALREPNLALFSPEATRRMPIWRWAEENAVLDFELLLSPVRVETEVSDAVRESARRQGLL